MVIKGDFYKMEQIEESSFFNLSLLTKINEGTDKERTEFKIVAYGIPFEECIKKIAFLRTWSLKGEFTPREFLNLYREVIKELDNDIE